MGLSGGVYTNLILFAPPNLLNSPGLTTPSLHHDLAPKAIVSSLRTESAAPAHHANLSTFVTCAKGTISHLPVVSQRPNPLPTPVRPHKLAVYLKDYDPRLAKYLTDGFISGFRIHSSTSPRSSVPSNHPSAFQRPSIVFSKLTKELQSGRISGPYLSIPFPNLICSPLGLVPKKTSNEFRLIHNLSFPRGESVYDGIPSDFSRVSYEDLDHCIHIIQSIGRGALIAKADLESAFRILPIHPLDYRFLGFTWNNLFYFDKCLPMGLSASCQHFEAFSSSLQFILTHHFKVPHTSHIVDDFIFFGPPGSNLCSISLRKFFILAEDLNIPIKQSKTVLPNSTVELHGIEVDTVRMEMRLPPDKLARAIDLLSSLQRRRSLLLLELQSVLGFLNFACKVIAHGRPFLRRLTDLTVNVLNPEHHIRLTKESRLDIVAWLSFLKEYNGVSIFIDSEWMASHTVDFYSDSSGLGFAAVFGTRYVQGSWPASWINYSIALKELYPITLAIELWGPLLSSKRILLYCDNQSVVAIINSQTSKCPLIMRLVRRLTVAAMSSNLVLRSHHIPGSSNTLADHLSRFCHLQARRVAPWLNESPDLIPTHLLPW
jgi:hypothetical protein